MTNVLRCQASLVETGKEGRVSECRLATWELNLEVRTWTGYDVRVDAEQERLCTGEDTRDERERRTVFETRFHCDILHNGRSGKEGQLE